MRGIYLLLISLSKDTNITIGSLGKLSFKRGNYAYVGSSQNSIEKRIERHISNKKKIHWHIDYFLSNKNARFRKVLWKEAEKEEECKIA